MMHYINEKGIYVSKMEDIRDLVSEDIYNAVEKIHEEEVLKLEEECKSGDEVIEEYEVRFDACKSELHEAYRNTEALLDMIIESKRLNRDKLKELAIEILKNIENGIDA